MKRLAWVIVVVVALTALWIPSTAEAQTGIKFGRAFSKFDDSEDSGVEYERRSDWTGGLFTRFGFGPLALQPEVLYTRRGAKARGEGVVGEPEIRITYIEAPVLLRLGRGATALYGGGYGAVQLDAEAFDSADPDATEVDVSDDLEELDYGIVFGLGIGFGKFEIDGRYTLGLRNLVKDPGAPEIKNRGLSVFGAFTF